MKLTIMNKIAIDTNILIYLIDNNDNDKHQIAKQLVVENPTVSVQVISEFLNVTKRLIKAPKLTIIDKCTEWLAFTTIQTVDLVTLKKASSIIKKYDFQIFDAIIVAAALVAKCHILYTEDMQHNLLVNKQLRILNPFISFL
ncbi:MAG: PIN domain-containing protein [Sphingobacteriales bacterium]|nr:MAG: PIN domain-containing protein [Sphingobacteriales bacterium]